MSLAERPEMLERVVGMPDTWAEFTTQDLVGNAHYPRIARELPQYVQFGGGCEVGAGSPERGAGALGMGLLALALAATRRRAGGDAR